MKKLLLLFILFLNLSYAQISKYYIKIDASVDFYLVDTFICFESLNLSKIEIPFYEKVLEMNSTQKCILEKDKIRCNLEFTGESKCFSIILKTKAERQKIKDSNFAFSYNLNVPLKSKEVSISMILPEGALISKDENSIFPKNYVITTDVNGRRILVNWKFSDIEAMDISLKVIAEILIRESFSYIYIILLISFASSISIAIIFLRRFRSKKIDEYKFLDENEKKVVEIIKSKRGKIVQKDLVKILGLSKAKVSRMVKEMERRGIIQIERRGKNNILKIKSS